MTDAFGYLIGFVLTRGEESETKYAPELMARFLNCQAFMADRAYDSDKIRALLRRHNIIAIIPSKKNRTTQIPHDEHLYKERRQNENLFARLKQKFRRLATRYDKTATSFIGTICFAAIYDWLKIISGI